LPLGRNIGNSNIPTMDRMKDNEKIGSSASSSMVSSSDNDITRGNVRKAVESPKKTKEVPGDKGSNFQFVSSEKRSYRKGKIGEAIDFSSMSLESLIVALEANDVTAPLLFQ